jgi:hypothetical protein
MKASEVTRDYLLQKLCLAFTAFPAFETEIRAGLQQLAQIPNERRPSNGVKRFFLYHHVDFFDLPNVFLVLEHIENVLFCLQSLTQCIVCVDVSTFDILVWDMAHISIDNCLQTLQKHIHPDKNYACYVSNHAEFLERIFQCFLNVRKLNNENVHTVNILCLSPRKITSVNQTYLVFLRWKLRRAALLVAARWNHGFFFHVLKLIALFL